MRKLILMRHAKAEHGAGVTDHARRLTERGREDSARVALFLQNHGLTPDLLIASDSSRTRETLEIAAAAFMPAPATRLDAGLYLAEPIHILKAIRATPPSVERLMLVGHNPGLAELALALAGGGEPDDVRNLAASFPTAAVAVLAFDARWADVRELGGRLERFIRARPLREAARDEEQKR